MPGKNAKAIIPQTGKKAKSSTADGKSMPRGGDGYTSPGTDTSLGGKVDSLEKPMPKGGDGYKSPGKNA